MTKDSIIKIPYARISTNNPSQLTSLGNQYDDLQEHGTVITDINSVGDGMTQNLKNNILKYKDKKQIELIVLSIDRISRDISDIKFIRDNISFITETREKRRYNVKDEWKIILQSLVTANDELDQIKKRAVKDNIKRKRAIENNEDEEFMDNNEFLKEKARNRCKISLKNLSKIGIEKKIAKNLEDIIRRSQFINSKKEWDEISQLSISIGGPDLRKNYYNIYKSYSRSINTIYRLTKPDVIDLMKNIIGTNFNTTFVNEFINANIHLIRNTTEKVDANNVDNLVKSIKKIKLEKNKESKVLDAIKEFMDVDS